MNITRRSWMSTRTAGFAAAGAVAGAGAWVLGPRAALAIAVGVAAAGGLVVLDWLRAQVRRFHTEAVRVQAAQDAAGTAVRKRLTAVEQRLRTDLAAAERRLRSTGSADLTAARKGLRAELAAMERRLQITCSGDLAALEKRLSGARWEPPRQGPTPGDVE